MTSKNQTPWTPGPWRLGDHNSDEPTRCVEDAYGRQVAVAAFVAPSGSPEDEPATFAEMQIQAAENARLITAAPEMAKWIAIMAETLSTMAALHGKPSAATPNEMEEMAKEARALLARVRGEEEA